MMKSLQQLLPFTLLMLHLYIHGNSAYIYKKAMLPGQLKIVEDFEYLLKSMVDNRTGNVRISNSMFLRMMYEKSTEV